MSLDLPILIIRTNPEQRRHLASLIEKMRSQPAAIVPLFPATEPGGVISDRHVARAPSGSEQGNPRILRGARAC